MTNVIEMMTSLYPVSDDTIQLLKDNVTPVSYTHLTLPTIA